jgi:iron complex outermembrane receptor protein
VSGQAKTGEGPWVFAAQGTKRETNDYDIPGPAMSKRLADFLGVPRTGPDKVVNSWSELEEYGVGGSYVTGVGYAGMSFKRTDSEYGTVAEEDVHIKLKQNRVDGRGELDYDLGPFAKIRAAAGYADYQHTEFEGSEPGTIFASTGWEGRVELVQRKRGGWQGSVGVQALQRDISAIGDEAVLPSTEVKEAGIFTVQRVDHGAFGLEAGARVDQRQLSSVVAERRFTDVSASGGVFWRPLTGLYLGLTVAHNERAPSEIELFAFGPHPATGQFLQGNPDFDAEKANSVEGAIHYGHDRLDGDLHLYYAKYDGFIDLRPTGAVDAGTGFPIFDYVQTDADFKGFEADASYKLWFEGERSLSVEGSADLVRAEGDLGPIARIPPWSVTGRLVYASPRWEAHAEVRHVAEQDRVADFELPTDAYTMVNLYGSVKPIEGSDVTLFAEVRNLTDEEAREHASALKDIAPLPGRNLRVGVTYKF